MLLHTTITTLAQLKAALADRTPRVLPQTVACNAEMAQHLLSLSRESERRRIRQPNVEKIYHDMIRGKFYLGNDMICILDDGTLGNGHHRLSACSLLPSGKTAPFTIRVGVRKEEMPTIDVGEKRDFTDYMAFAGGSQTTNFFLSPRNIAAVAKSILQGGRSTSPVNHRVIEAFAKRYSRQINHLSQYFAVRKNRIYVGPLLSLVLQIKIHLDETNAPQADHDKFDRLLAFVAAGQDNLSSSEFFHGRDTCGMLVKFLLDDNTKTSNAANHHDVYTKLMNLIHNYMTGKPVFRIAGTEKNFYPINLDWVQANLIQPIDRAPLSLGLPLYQLLTQHGPQLCNGEYTIKELVERLALNTPQQAKSFRTRLSKLAAVGLHFDTFSIVKGERNSYLFTRAPIIPVTAF